MLQTHADRYWTMQQPYSYSPHMRSYTSPQHNAVHHHTPIHHHHMSHPVHHFHPSFSSPQVTMAPHQSHQHPQAQSEPRISQMTISDRDFHQYNEVHSQTQGYTLEGFPSRPQFENLLNEYILSLSPKKRDKALIPQKRYDNILAVLKDPKCTTIESAQFRFWAKKMFRLSTDGPNSNIVCHEGKPVAVRERLYQVLTESHHRAQHGGRDKTSAEVRKHYSWVPKELIARFVRHCPSCALRRSTPVDYPALPSRSQTAESTYVKMEPMGNSPSYSKTFDSLATSSVYTKSESPESSYSSSSPAHSPMSPVLRHPSNESLHTTVSVTTQSMPQLQAIAGGGVMSTSAEAAYQYAVANAYGSGISEGPGAGLVGVHNMDPHGLYSRGGN